MESNLIEKRMDFQAGYGIFHRIGSCFIKQQRLIDCIIGYRPLHYIILMLRISPAIPGYKLKPICIGFPKDKNRQILIR